MFIKHHTLYIFENNIFSLRPPRDLVNLSLFIESLNLDYHDLNRFSMIIVLVLKNTLPWSI